MLRAFDHYLIVSYNLYTVTYSCYYGVLEIADLLEDYFIFHKDLKILWFNLGYNFGTLITSIKNIWMWNVAKEYTRIEDSFTMGMEMGQMFWMIFYPTETYLDQSLADPDAEWGQDYTWDAVIHRRTLEPGEEYEPVSAVVVDAVSARTQRHRDPSEDARGINEFLSKFLPYFKPKAATKP